MYLSGAGLKYTKSEIATTDPKWWSEAREYGITDPDIKTNGDEALVSMNYRYGKGRFQAAVTLVKENGNWFVMKLAPKTVPLITIYTVNLSEYEIMVI